MIHLLDRGFDPNGIDVYAGPSSGTPLFEAAVFNNVEGVRLLLARGADPPIRQPRPDRNTVLEFTRREHRYLPKLSSEVEQLLVEAVEEAKRITQEMEEPARGHLERYRERPIKQVLP